MIQLTHSLRAATRAPSARLAVPATPSRVTPSFRSLHACVVRSADENHFADSPPPTATSTRKSASDPKEGQQPARASSDEMKQTHEQMGGAEMEYGTYGGGDLKQGNFTNESQEGKERKGAAKQGEQ